MKIMLTIVAGVLHVRVKDTTFTMPRIPKVLEMMSVDVHGDITGSSEKNVSTAYDRLCADLPCYLTPGTGISFRTAGVMKAAQTFFDNLDRRYQACQKTAASH